MLEVDWSRIFGVDTSLAELLVRGTVMYWFLFAMFRFVMRREAGQVGIADILIVVIIADASQNAFSGEYRSVTEGVVLVATLVFWNVLIDWLSFRSPAFARFAEPAPLLLIRDGRLLERNMRREMLTRDELLGKLREQGVEKPEEVRWAPASLPRRMLGPCRPLSRSWPLPRRPAACGLCPWYSARCRRIFLQRSPSCSISTAATAA
jgi:hypothetical protein